jgi:hypothetical protein
LSLSTSKLLSRRSVGRCSAIPSSTRTAGTTAQTTFSSSARSRGSPAAFTMSTSGSSPPQRRRWWPSASGGSPRRAPRPAGRSGRSSLAESPSQPPRLRTLSLSTAYRPRIRVTERSCPSLSSAASRSSSLPSASSGPSSAPDFSDGRLPGSSPTSARRRFPARSSRLWPGRRAIQSCESPTGCRHRNAMSMVAAIRSKSPYRPRGARSPCWCGAACESLWSHILRPSPSSSARSVRPFGSRSRTSACRRKSWRSSTTSAYRARASSRWEMPSGAGSNAISTTVLSSACSPSRMTCASTARRQRPRATSRPRPFSRQRPAKHRLPSASFATSPTASTRRS